jgi:hypothetical protein
MDPLAFLEETDPVVVAVAVAISRRWVARWKELADYQANETIRRLGEAMRK